MFEHVVDVVVIALTGAHDTGTVELLADALADV